MADSVSKEVRSKIMASIRQKGTNPELCVRSLLHRLGYRFRLHRNDLPGTPDIVLPRYRTTIFVHGCFWHQHPGCPKSRRPSSNTEYWSKKLTDNEKRDAQKANELKKLGWNVLTIWECEMKDRKVLQERLQKLIN